MKEFRFVVEYTRKDDTKGRKILTTRSKHLQGAVRKLYQEYEFDEIKQILFD